MLLALFLATAARPQGQPSFRELDYAGARVAAQAEHKLLLLDFHRPKSLDCERMATTTWPSPITQVWLQSNFVAIHVDVDADRSTAERYDVTTVPTVLIANAQGFEIDRLGGFIAPMDLLEKAKPMVRGAARIGAARERLAADPGDPRLHWELGQAFRRSRLDHRVLEALLRAWDLGATRPEFANDREGSLAYELAVHAHNYKPAQRVLAARCKAARAQVASLAEGLDLPRVARDLALLNDAIGRMQDTLDLRAELARRTPPPQAVLNALFSEGVAKMLHRARRYDELLACRGDVLVYVDTVVAQIGAAQREIEALRNSAADQLDQPEIETYDPVSGQIELAIASCVMCFEALVGSGREAEAGDVLRTVVGLSSTGLTYARFVSAAGRAGDVEYARAIGAGAMQKLTEKNDQAFVRRALDNLENKGKR